MSGLSTSPAFRISWSAFGWGGGGILVLALVIAGCAGGGTYSLDEGALAQRFLPSTRSLDHHPDSLQALSVRTEEDSTLAFEMERDYASLWQKWSSSFQNMGTGRTRRSRTYATLWGWELSLASLQPDMGIQGLSGSRARELLAQRRANYRETLQIDVFWFESEGNSAIAGPGARVTLEVGGQEYRPSEEDYGPLREAFLENASTGLYRRNTFRFPRIVDDRDILEGADQLSLHVRLTGGGNRVRFRWTWEDAQAAARGGRSASGRLAATGS
jgi:hypothetical protein